MDPCAAVLGRVPLEPPAGWSVSCQPSRPGYLGQTVRSSATIVLYLRDGWSADEMARVYAHEIGHAHDVTKMTSADRQRWLELRGVDAGWFGCSGCTDFATGAGDFAEVVAWVHVPATRHLFASQMAGPPGADAIAFVHEILNR